MMNREDLVRLKVLARLSDLVFETLIEAGYCPDPVVQAQEHIVDPAPHLLGRLLGECERQDLGKRHLPVGKQDKTETIAQNAGLAGARSGGHYHVAVVVQGTGLRQRQIFEHR